MNLKFYVPFTFGFLTVSMVPLLPFASTQLHAAEAQTVDDRVAEGDWGGPMGDGYITFRFKFDNGSWRGWFVSGIDGKLYPVENLRIAGRSVSFTHKSKPEIVFSLSMAKDNRTMSGTGSRPDGSASLYTLTRKPI